MYRIGLPGWKWVASFGVRLLLRIDVHQDKEAGVFIATSPDLPGLVVEAKTMEELFREAYGCVDMLVTEQLAKAPRKRPSVAWPGNLIPA